MPRELTTESKLLRFHSASYERAIPGYAGSRNCQPKYTRQITRMDNPYGTKYNDLSSLQHTTSFKVITARAQNFTPASTKMRQSLKLILSATLSTDVL